MQIRHARRQAAAAWLVKGDPFVKTSLWYYRSRSSCQFEKDHTYDNENGKEMGLMPSRRFGTRNIKTTLTGLLTLQATTTLIGNGPAADSLTFGTRRRT